MRNAGLEEAQAGIKIARRNINNLRYADDTTLMAEGEEELKSLLMKVKEESGNVDLKLSIQKTNIMASGPITPWQIDGETVGYFIFLASKITADGDGSHEIKRCFLLGRKVMTNLNSILKSRDIILPAKVCLVKAMVFPVVMYGCERWTIKKAEHWRIDAFELWCWRRFLSVPWTARRSNRDWGQEEKGTTEDEMVGWQHRHGFGWTPGVGNGQQGLAWSNSGGHKESDMTEQLNWTETELYHLAAVTSIHFQIFIIFIILCILYYILYLL